MSNRFHVKYIKPGEKGRIGGEESDLSLIVRAQRKGKGGEPTADAIAARNTLILRHEAFIWMKTRAACAGGHRGNASKWDQVTEDLFAEGVDAFCRAVKMFEPKFGWTLLTYAGVAITQGVWRARNCDTAVTRTAKNNAVKCGTFEQWERARAVARLHNAATGEPIDPAHLSPRYRTKSHAPEVIDRVTHEAELLAVKALMARLDAREAEVLRMRFLEDRTLVETGRHFGLTRERVRQIQDRAMAKLQKMAMEDGHLVGTACSKPAPVNRRGVKKQSGRG